jgi:methylated-DNA-[protein]-cysteine S-methyltransferase
MSFAIYESPFGALILIGGVGGLRHLYFPRRAPAQHEAGHAPDQFAAACQQLEEYFVGARQTFDLPLDLRGTAFQQRVWRALQQIPYGTTTTYGALARELAGGHPGGPPEPRAVAAAIARTPIPIVIPCHRVLGADGSLTGYLGGLRRKQALLDFEAAAGDRSVLDAAWHQRQLSLL